MDIFDVVVDEEALKKARAEREALFAKRAEAAAKEEEEEAKRAQAEATEEIELAQREKGENDDSEELVIDESELEQATRDAVAALPKKKTSAFDDFWGTVPEPEAADGEDAEGNDLFDPFNDMGGSGVTVSEEVGISLVSTTSKKKSKVSKPVFRSRKKKK